MIQTIYKNNGFKISIIYLFLETNTENIYRVKNRVLNGGHNVPKEDIIRRYYRSRKLFENNYKALADEWMLFFNGDDNFELVENQDIVYDEALKQLFTEGIKYE